MARRRAQKQTHTLSTITNSLSLAALSPYRFPLDVERIAVHSARIGGFAFVFLGMVFTYHYIESTVTEIAVETAQVASVAAAAPCADCAAEEKTPPVAFAYTPVDRGETLITLDVADAVSVTVYAFDVRSGTYQRLGAAAQTADTTWQYMWNTEGVAPGEYWIKAIVENAYGVYDRSDSRYVTVE